MLSTRIFTAAVLLSILALCLFVLPAWAWQALLLVFGGAALWEYSRLAQIKQAQQTLFFALSLLVFAILIALSGQIGTQKIAFLVALFALPFWLVLMPVCLHQKWQNAGSFVLGWLIIFPVLLSLNALHHQNPKWILALICLTAIADTAAYFCGRAYGKRLLAPFISPKKTWEGVIGACVVLTAITFFTAQYFDLHIGIIMAFVWLLFAYSVMGDLFESLQKRQAHMKDSSQLLPGHGGVLDRIDSLLPTAPIALCLLHFYPCFAERLA